MTGQSGPSLDEREYDLISRHLLVSKILTEVAPTGPILDIGGSEGLTRGFLSDRSVVAVDVRPTGVDVLGSGACLPFGDRTFAAAIALDVLEHVPDDLKSLIVGEAGRVADVVVIAGPFDAEEVRSSERHQREIFKRLFGSDHLWLQEHHEFGLPALGDVLTELGNAGFETHVFGSNPLPLWNVTLMNTHVALKLGVMEVTRPLRSWMMDHFLEKADATPPSYRHFVTAARIPGRVRQVDRLVPGHDELLTAEAVNSTEEDTAGLIAHAWEVKLGAAVHGWTESAQRVRQVEYESSSDRHSLESFEALISQGLTYRDLISGPAVTADGETNTMPSPQEYADWLACRPRAAPPLSGPSFSIITPVFNPKSEFIADCIRSVRAQSYPQWELVLVDVSDAPHVLPLCKRFASLDDRITIVGRDNQGIAVNTNAGADAAHGEWLVFLDHDDTLEPHALAALAQKCEEEPSVDFIYSDEDKLAPDGSYHDPFFKPDWSPDLLRSVNYIAHLVAVRRDLFDRIEGLRGQCEGAQDYDFVLRATAAAANVQHISDVLYHWRQHESSTAHDVAVKPGAHGSGRRALRDFAEQTVPGAWVDAGAGATAHRLRYPVRSELISIIIPFRDQATMTEACLSSLARHGSSLPFEVLLVSNRSEEEETHEAVSRWKKTWPWVRSLDYDEPFNFQSLGNWAADQSSGRYLVFLNNDIEVFHAGWLEALAEHAQQPSVGAVGPRLFYPNGLVQHAGVAVGIGGFAEHPWARLHPDAVTPAGPSYWTRNVTAVTAACMMVGKEKFDAVGGFDERFVVCGGDVDLCLRLSELGLRHVMTPYARLIHHESVTRERQAPWNDVHQSLCSYAALLSHGDPYYNRNLTLSDTSCRLARPDERPPDFQGLELIGADWP